MRKREDIRRLNLKRLIARYATQREFAAAIELVPAHVSQMVNGVRNVGNETAEKIETRLALGAGWLDREHPDDASEPPPWRPILEWERPEDLPEDHYVIVPRVRVRLSAGNGHLVFEEEEGPPLAFTTRWIKSRGLTRSMLVLVHAAGDSMEPRIQDGDLLLIDRGQTAVKDGRVYVLRYGSELRIKRLYRRYDGGLIIRSDHSAKYPDEAVPPHDLAHVEVIGRVVWVAGEM